MVMLQRAFLYIVMFNSFCLFAMKYDDVSKLNADTCAADIRDRIDRDHLGVNEDACFRRLSGSLFSWFRNKFLTYKIATKEMNKIESYIPKDADKKSVLQKLVAQHWYMNYLMQALVCQKVEELDDITGRTIDRLYSDELYGVSDENGAKKIASKLFFDNAIGKKLIDIMPTVLSNIHFTILYGPHGNINPSSLGMSANGKYLRATDDDNIHSIWDMKTGEIINSLQIENIEWIRRHKYVDYEHKNNALLGGYSCMFEERYRVIDNDDNYCAMVTNSYMPIDSEFFPIDAAHNRKAIVLFKRPEVASYLCQKAFDNSYIRFAELVQLSGSKAFNAVEGFPQKNLERIISNRIQQLTPKKDL